MHSETKRLTHSHSRTQPADRHGRKPRAATRRAIRFILTPAIIVIILIASHGRALAKSGKHVDPHPPSAVDSHAINSLTAMGAYLRTLQVFQVQAVISTDDVRDNGQIVQSSADVNLLASRPNKLRMEEIGDEVNRLYFYDGKNFTIWGQLAGYYATVPAPPTISELADKLTDRFDINLPLVDLFRWGTEESDINKIKAAIDVGPSSVDGVTCEQYAFHQDDIDWQIWIQLGAYPLPRKIVITTLTDEARPQHSEVLTWNLAPSFDGASFTFDPPSDAHRIPVVDIQAESEEKNK
jgi:hypothetical protein